MVPFLAWILLAPVAVASTRGSDAPADGARAPSAATAPAPLAAADPLSLARVFLDQLESERGQQTDRALALVEACLAARSPALAARLADRIPDRVAETSARFNIAVEFQRQGLEPEALAQMQTAERLAAAFTDQQAQIVAPQRALALSAFGRHPEAEAVRGSIAAEGVRNHAWAACFEFIPDDRMETALDGFLEAVLPDHPAAAGRAELMVARRLCQQGRVDAAKARLPRLLANLSRKADTETIPNLREAVDVALACGDETTARHWAGVTLGFARRTGRLAYWRPRDLTLASEALLATGQKEEAAEVLGHIPATVAEIDLQGYARAGMMAGESFFLKGEPEAFHDAAVHVLRRLREHPHFRARAMSALDVLATYLRRGIAIPPRVGDELLQTARSVESAPAFQNPI